MSDLTLTRRNLLQATLLGLTAFASLRSGAASVKTIAPLCEGDLAIDESTAMLWPAAAPLTPAPGRRDARAVWARVLPHPDSTALIFLHGHDNYVTVDSHGRSRIPDWAADDPAARAGALGRLAAPLAYGLDRLTAAQLGGSPILLVPEDAALSHGSFWATEPRGQYADPARLGRLLADARAHLACLHRPHGGDTYLTSREAKSPIKRLYLAGHSGAGLPLQEAAASQIALPGKGGVPTDLWLFDCTYWSEIANFVKFCAAWHKAGRLGGNRADCSRFACVYRPGTQTEAIAEILRAEIAKALGVPPDSLTQDRTAEEFTSEFFPAQASGVSFIRTNLPHDEIPTRFIPELIASARV